MDLQQKLVYQLVQEGISSNGILDPGEECDDGNSVNGDGCTAACKVEKSVPALSQPALVILLLLFLASLTVVPLLRR